MTLNPTYRAPIILLVSLLCLILIQMPLSAWSNQDVNENPLSATASIEPNQIPAGGQGAVKIEIEIADHHKAYLDMFKLQTSSLEGVKIGGIEVNPTFEFEDKFSKKKRVGVKGKALITAPIDIAESVTPQKQKIKLALTYQACSEEYCLFPKVMELDTDLEIMPKGQAAAATSSGGGSEFEKALNKSLAYAFLFVFLAGLATSLTPCIFPMIPITLAVIGARSQGQTKLKGFTMSLAYVFGIAITYAIMGVIAARTGALFGSALGNPMVVTIIAIIFVTMALSMYGVFEFRVPAFIGDRLNSTKTEKGYFGAFVTGLIAGVVASPCVGPVLVSVLTFVAQTQNMVLGFFLLFTFALGIGQLFLVLGTFSTLTQKLPRSGGWMEGVKFFFGTSMVALALYYLSPVISSELFYILMGIAIVLISSAYGAFEANQKLETPPQKIVKGVMLTAFLIGVLYLVLGLFGSRISLGGAAGAGPSTAEESFKKLDWKEYSDSALEAAKKDGKPVIIDFWADWCAACKELEKFTFTDPRIQDESKNFVLLKINATTDNDEVQRLKKIYKVVGLPTLIFYSSKGEIRTDLTLTGFENADAFLARMKKL